mgnify:CR=1 FL=1
MATVNGNNTSPATDGENIQYFSRKYGKINKRAYSIKNALNNARLLVINALFLKSILRRGLGDFIFILRI